MVTISEAYNYDLSTCTKIELKDIMSQALNEQGFAKMVITHYGLNSR